MKGSPPDVTDHLDIGFEPALLEALEKRKDFLLQHRFIHNGFDIEVWIDRGPLERALASVGR